MQQGYDQSYVRRYTALGVVIGLLFVGLVAMVQLLAEGEHFTLSFFLRVHRVYPMMYLIDLMPLASGLLTFYAARAVSRSHREYLELARDREDHQGLLYRFVMGLREGREVDYQPAQDDSLGSALVSLRDELAQQLAAEQQRQVEDERRRWVAEGLAEFGEILRTVTGESSLKSLSYSIVSRLVKYLEANQCGLYMVEGEAEDDRHLQLMGCYAYDREKFAAQRLEWGDGLVGACALEGETTYLDQVPDGYLRITSGLGEATARHLLLVPVKLENVVFGVLEIASFKPFEAYRVDFCERVAATIASSLKSIRISIQTTQLLNEKERQADALALKEREISQNMEELTASQEEVAQKTEQLQSFTDSVNHTLIHAEYTVDGQLIVANDKFLEKLGYSDINEILGKPILSFINSKDQEWFEGVWSRLIESGQHFEGDLKQVMRGGGDIWTLATYTCILNSNREVDRVLFLAIDTTDAKLQNLDSQGQIEALNRVSIKLELTALGDVIKANDTFFTTLGYEPKDVLKQPIYHLFPKNEQAQFEETLRRVCRGETFVDTIRVRKKNGRESWLRVSLTTVMDMYGDIAKVVFIANDITREKLMEVESRQQNEKLKLQEEKLKQNEAELSRRLREATDELKTQFREIEKVQKLNEKTLEGFLDAIITTDHDGTVTFFNRAAEEVFSVDRKEVLGRNVAMLFPEDVVASSEFLQAYIDPQGRKIIGARKEVDTRDFAGEDLNLLMLLSEAQMGRTVRYTAFIQNNTVDLF